MVAAIESLNRQVDTVVIGGGLAGLTAAALVARAGRSVVVLERTSHLGGRAATHVRDGIHFNLGAHALYCHGHAFRLLTDLRVAFTGRIPSPKRALLVDGDVQYPRPTGLASLLKSRLLTLREKWRFFRLLTRFPRIDTRELDRTPLRDWIERTAGQGRLAKVLRAMTRVSTYTDDPVRASAGAAIDQIRLGLAGNVWYLDGGWQTIVNGLRARAVERGADVCTGLRAKAVDCDEDGVAVRLDGGTVLRARTAILATGPDEAAGLLQLPNGAPLSQWAMNRVPVRASCLDVALRKLPRPDNGFALGLDRPLYYSLHSASARFAPDGVAVIHVMKYLGADHPTPAVEEELERFLEQLQPGWQKHVVARRFLPGMIAAHALARADEGGLAGRPPTAVAERPNAFLAGDWVGGRGMLADASAASAEEAAGLALAALTQPQRSPCHA